MRDIRQFAEDVLHAETAYQAAVEAKMKELEAQGYTIIEGGQESEYDDEGRNDWSYRNYRTGELVASGHDTCEDRGKPLQDELFCSTDQIENEVPLAECPAPPDGMLPALAESLRDWVVEADPEDLAKWLGWPVEKVETAQGS